LVGGATGRIEFERLFIQYLWVAESHRNQGLGTNLLSRIEQAACELKCSDALVETLSDQTATMYRRVGYAPLAEIANYIPGYTRHVLLKQLPNPSVERPHNGGERLLAPSRSAVPLCAAHVKLGGPTERSHHAGQVP
jgi:predicted N-acetyltransferase YhbS